MRKTKSRCLRSCRGFGNERCQQASLSGRSRRFTVRPAGSGRRAGGGLGQRAGARRARHPHHCASRRRISRLQQAYPDDLGLIGLVAIAPAKAQSANSARRDLHAVPVSARQRRHQSAAGPAGLSRRPAASASSSTRAAFRPTSSSSAASWSRPGRASSASRCGLPTSPRPGSTATIRLPCSRRASTAISRCGRGAPIWRASAPARMAASASNGRSQSLNDRWFAGSRWSPADDTCSGNGWRKLIGDGIRQAALATGCCSSASAHRARFSPVM